MVKHVGVRRVKHLTAQKVQSFKLFLFLSNTYNVTKPIYRRSREFITQTGKFIDKCSIWQEFLHPVDH